MKYLVFINIILSLNVNIKAQNMNITLNQKQQKIVTIAANTAIGNLERLKIELNQGLDAGLTVNQIKEILVQMYAYAGFPRSIQGISTFMEVINERKMQGITDSEGKEASPIKNEENKYEIGKKNLELLTRIHETKLSGVNLFAPVIDTFLKEHLFADIFERDILTFQERELATISALTVINGVEPMLQSHMNMGLNTGLTALQSEEILSLLKALISQDQENTVKGIIRKVLNNR